MASWHQDRHLRLLEGPISPRRRRDIRDFLLVLVFAFGITIGVLLTAAIRG